MLQASPEDRGRNQNQNEKRRWDMKKLLKEYYESFSRREG